MHVVLQIAPRKYIFSNLPRINEHILRIIKLKVANLLQQITNFKVLAVQLCILLKPYLATS